MIGIITLLERRDVMERFRIIKHIDGNGKEYFLPQYKLLWLFWLTYGTYDDEGITEYSSYEEAVRAIKKDEDRKRRMKRKISQVFGVKI